MVDSATLWIADEGFYNRQLSDEELNKVIELFNSAKVEIKNTHFEGMTPSYGISVKLKFWLNHISINKAATLSGGLEIQRTVIFKR
jgi:hypothetical protein